MATRGRSGRMAVYGVCGVIVILFVLLYRGATTEMTRLNELHVQCTHQQEALEAQLQVIFEYKIRLEKSLSDEKSSNAAIKQELRERTNREKSLRDKSSIEAMQRFNSLQQQHKILQSENQDLKDERDKRKKEGFENNTKLEATLQQLRKQINKMQDENLFDDIKNKYNTLNLEKTEIEKKYHQLINNHINNNITIRNLNIKLSQLNQQLRKTKMPCKENPNEENFLKSQSTAMLLSTTISTTVSSVAKLAQNASLLWPQRKHHVSQ